MKNIRLISRLDVKGSNLIKGVHLEGLRIIGNPQDHAVRYYKQGADELIYMDVEGLEEALGTTQMCRACITDEYPTSLENVEELIQLRKKDQKKVAGK